MVDRRVAEPVFPEPRLDILENLRPQREQPVKQLVESEFSVGMKMRALHGSIMLRLHDNFVNPVGVGPQASFGKSCINPPAMNSTATAARINPMTRVATLIP